MEHLSIRSTASGVRLSVVFCAMTMACAPQSSPTDRDSATADPGAELTSAFHEALLRDGWIVDSLVGISGSNAVVSARPIDRAGLYLLAIRQVGGEVTLLGADLLPEGSLPQRMEWMPLSGRDTLFVYSHDVPVEGLVSTVASVIERDSLRRVYFDTEPVCRPSEFRDLDGDGVVELLSYSTPLCGGDCSSRCSLLLNERFPSATHWTEVHRWNGSKWTPASEAFPDFYRGLTDAYTSAFSYVEGPAGSAEGCGPDDVAWLSERVELLADWARQSAILGAAPASPR